jgi:hypothetical protein
LVLGLAFGIVGPAVREASATVIDFEAQAAGRGGVFTSTVDSPLVIGTATFTGGELLKNETNSVDLTGVYATASFAANHVNPLTINFSAPVSGFSILVSNNFADTYTVADNLGGSSSLALALNSMQTFTLPDAGITSVTIRAANSSSYDYAIDNVSFTPQAVPEPSTMMLGGIGAVAGLGYGAVRRRRSRKV